MITAITAARNAVAIWKIGPANWTAADGSNNESWFSIDQTPKAGNVGVYPTRWAGDVASRPGSIAALIRPRFA